MPRTYIWERPDWPNFSWRAERLIEDFARARRGQGTLLGAMSAAGFREQQRLDLDARTDEAVETTAIEGEPVSRIATRSSIARLLRIDAGGVAVADARARGLAELTLDATLGWDRPLTLERLHHWHTLLAPFPAGRRAIIAGAFRTDADGPMQVVSVRIDRPTVHFEAPPAGRLATEIERFLRWFEAPGEHDWLLRSAIAHLWFVTLHPYEDGNGRIARAVADLALARDERSARRFFSVSRRINETKVSYYDALERAQSGTLDVTEWMLWFLDCYTQAVDAGLRAAQEIIRADAFWRFHAGVAFSSRQRKVIERFLVGFEGTLTAKKWAALAKTSHATAARDLAELLEHGVLIKNAGGSKNTSYSPVLPPFLADGHALPNQRGP